jgi:hypothetical protein
MFIVFPHSSEGLVTTESVLTARYDHRYLFTGLKVDSALPQAVSRLLLAD